jgi:hypothetical protein
MSTPLKSQTQLKSPAPQTDQVVTKLFNGAIYLAEKNKQAAREQLLRIQILLAQRPVR